MDYYTSDTHFDHVNVIKHCNRPFENVEQMNEVLIQNWNNRVSPTDRVFHLGDFSLGSLSQAQSIFNRLNGQKHLIIGNHDKTSCRIKGWNWVRPYYEVKTNEQTIVLCHYAMRVWNKSHWGSWMLYGHSHGNLSDDPSALSIDVGVDCHNYMPISIGKISQIMEQKTINKSHGDQHG